MGSGVVWPAEWLSLRAPRPFLSKLGGSRLLRFRHPFQTRQRRKLPTAKGAAHEPFLTLDGSVIAICCLAPLGRLQFNREGEVMTFMRGNDNPSNAEIKSTTKFKSTTKIKMSLCFVTSLLLIFSAGCSTSPKPGSTTPPTVLSEGPPSAAAGSCQNTVVNITFSKAMNASTIDTTTFTLTAPGPTPVLGVVTYAAASDTATFTPSGPLVLNTAYTATITTGATDTFGNAMAANFVWSFTTGTAACQAGAPTVISSAPVNGSTGVCPNAVVIAGFGGPMDASTIDATTFTLTGPTAAAATGTVAYDATNRFATFTPTSSLALNSLYTATITTGAMDTSGNAVAADFVWSFTTGSTACQTAAPTVVASVPLK